MPVIELQGDPADGARVLSYMYFPANAADRDHLFSDLNLSNDEVMQSESEETLAERRTASRWTKKVSDTGLRGTNAGEMLVWLAMMRRANWQEPSMHKAVFAMRDQTVGLIGDPETGEISDAREDKAPPLTKARFGNTLQPAVAVDQVFLHKAGLFFVHNIMIIR